MAVLNVSGQSTRGATSARWRSALAGYAALVVLGLVVAFGWTMAGLIRPTAATAQAAGLAREAARPASITYREPLPGGALISLEMARQSAERFSGQDELALEGGLEAGPFGAGTFEIYYLEGAAAETAGEQSFKVDGRSGEVLEATRLDRIMAPSRGWLSPLEAESRAERFVAERFLGFKTMSLVERSANPGPNGSRLYSFKWAMLATESGAELPTSVSVSLSAGNGEVVWYLAQRDSTTVDARPQVSREAAISSAAGLVDRTGRWDARAPNSVRLQVVYSPNQLSRQQLVWGLTFPSRPDEAAPGRPDLRILIDAHSGEALASPS